MSVSAGFDHGMVSSPVEQAGAVFEPLAGPLVVINGTQSCK
jgi:hypothetical protein